MARAEPVWQGTCLAAGVPAGFVGQQKIHYFVAAGSAARVNLCNSETRNLTDQQFANLVQAAAEVWNRESWGTSLIFGGISNNVNLTTDDDINNTFCIPTALKPAVVVGAVLGCPPTNGGGACVGPTTRAISSDVDAGLINPNNCYSVRLGTQEGTLGTCVGQASNPDWFSTVDFYPWNTTFPLVAGVDDPRHAPGPTPPMTNDLVEDDLLQILIHELGHVLNLDHPNVTNRSMVTPGLNVNATVYEGGVWTSARHLFPYDKDCVDNASSVRSVDYAWRSWDPLPAPGTWSSLSFKDATWPTTRIMTAGGALRSSTASTSSYFGLFRVDPLSPTLVDRFRTDTVGTTGALSFGAEYSITGGTVGRPAGTYVAPQLMSPWERVWNTGNNARLNFVRMWTDPAMAGSAALVDAEEPPRWEHLRSNDLFVSGTFETNAYRYRCDTPSAVFPSGDFFCQNSYKTLTSHVPIATAWDPVSSRSLFAVVDTQRRHRANNAIGTAAEKERVDANGRIFILPGFENVFTNISLNRPTYLPKWPMDCTDPADQPYCDEGVYRYEQETEATPGLACAPEEYGFTLLGLGPYNCLLAWSDRGSPNFRILYTYFRIINDANGNPVADFWPTNYVLEGASTVANVSAAWFGESFQLAWKSLGTSAAPAQVRRAHNATSSVIGWTVVPGGWGTMNIVDPPTFVYDPFTSGREAGLIWSEVH